jgi:hypothetical protein
MKLFLAIFAAILCAALVIKGVNVAASRWTAAPAKPPVKEAKAPTPPPHQARTYQKKPRIVLRSLTEIGSLPGAGNITVSVQDERIDYASDDEAAAAMPEEAKLATYLVRITVENTAKRTLDLGIADVSELLEGMDRLPVPFVAHSDYATASFRFQDRLILSVVRAARKNHLEITLDDVAFTTEVGQLEMFKRHLRSAQNVAVSRDKGQRTPLTPTGSPAKHREPEFIPLPTAPTSP